MAPATAARRRAHHFGYTGEHFTTDEWLELLARIIHERSAGLRFSQKGW